jgi:hypothetical protein
MRSLFLALLAVLVIAIPAMAANWDNIENSGPQGYDPPTPGPTFDWTRTVLYDNGPIFNSAGTGTGGANESVLQDTSLLMANYGWGGQISANNTLSDDFVIPAGESWNISDIVFFSYQSGSPTSPSTYTDCRLVILDGPPDLLTSAVVWGDPLTNVLATSVWSNTYRNLQSTPHGTTRPIMANTCTVGTTLPAGHYWVISQAAGTGASGPWYPPVAIWDVCVTGDGWQGIAGVYAAMNDPGAVGGSICRQALPFLVNGVIVGGDTGACCNTATGDCTVTTQAGCTYAWLGVGVPCNIQTCVPPVPTERASWGQIKHTYR